MKILNDKQKTAKQLWEENTRKYVDVYFISMNFSHTVEDGKIYKGAPAVVKIRQSTLTRCVSKNGMYYFKDKEKKYIGILSINRLMLRNNFNNNKIYFQIWVLCEMQHLENAFLKINQIISKYGIAEINQQTEQLALNKRIDLIILNS